QGKGQTGLDQHQLRLWHSFHRHTALSMCALAQVLAATLFAHESAMLGVHGAAGLGDAGCLGSGLAGVTWVACYLVSPAGCSWAGLGVSRLRVCRTGARAGSVGLGGVS